MQNQQTNLHGTCLRVGGRGVLIIGPPGSGKSDLALRLIDAPGYGISANPMRSELVSDDQVIVARQGTVLVASAPASILGKLEVRGLDIVELETVPSVDLTLVVRLLPQAGIERLPGALTFEILGLSLPLVEIDAASVSAPARLRAAVSWLCDTLK